MYYILLKQFLYGIAIIHLTSCSKNPPKQPVNVDDITTKERLIAGIKDVSENPPNLPTPLVNVDDITTKERLIAGIKDVSENPPNLPTPLVNVDDITTKERLIVPGIKDASANPPNLPTPLVNVEENDDDYEDALKLEIQNPLDIGIQSPIRCKRVEKSSRIHQSRKTIVIGIRPPIKYTFRRPVKCTRKKSKFPPSAPDSTELYPSLKEVSAAISVQKEKVNRLREKNDKLQPTKKEPST